MKKKKKITESEIRVMLKIRGFVPLRIVMLFFDNGTANGIFRTIDKFYVFGVKDNDLKLVEIARGEYWEFCHRMGLRPELSIKEVLDQDKVTIEDLLNM